MAVDTDHLISDAHERIRLSEEMDDNTASMYELGVAQTYLLIGILEELQTIRRSVKWIETNQGD